MVAFRDLWYRHPANNSTQYPCIAPHGLTNMEGTHIIAGFPVFGNQCAIRMGAPVKNAGVPPGAVRATTCTVHSAEEMHTVRATELAQALAGASIEAGRARSNGSQGQKRRTFTASSTAAPASSISRTTGSGMARRLPPVTTSMYGTAIVRRPSG